MGVSSSKGRDAALDLVYDGLARSTIVPSGPLGIKHPPYVQAERQARGPARLWSDDPPVSP